jgi:hypothetical protein
LDHRVDPVTALLGLDYAGGRPGGAAIKAAGFSFVVRYLTSGGVELPGKLLTPAEMADLAAHDVMVACNYEKAADRMLDGYAAGVSDAQEATAVCLSLGHPSTHAAYFSADFDATPAQQAEIDDYLRGCASVIGLDRVGIYGGYWVVKRCLDNHTATWAWQGSGWSPRNPDGSVLIDHRAHIFQRLGTVTVGGVECDVNEALQPDFGQHPTSARRRETPVCYRLDPTPLPTSAAASAVPDGTWDAVEDTISTPGPAGGWPGRIVMHLTAGYQGVFVQESWSAPSGTHYVPRWDPVKKTGGRYINAFNTQNWELPTGDTALIVRYATRNRGSVTAETQN